MSKNEAACIHEANQFEVITYEEEVAFNYTLPGEEETRTIESEVTLIWEDGLDKFKEEHGDDKAFEVHTFKLENHRNFFIHQVETRTEELIEEIEEEIANKMKYGFEFTGQLHNDD
jgi:hypothetical protein